jgi:hypothetical protein
LHKRVSGCHNLPRAHPELSTKSILRQRRSEPEGFRSVATTTVRSTSPMPEYKAGSTFYTSKTRRGRFPSDFGPAPRLRSETPDPANARAGKRLTRPRRNGKDGLPIDDFSRSGNRNQFHRSANRIPFDHAQFRVWVKCDHSEISAKRETVCAKKFDRRWNANRFQ